MALGTATALALGLGLAGTIGGAVTGQMAANKARKQSVQDQTRWDEKEDPANLDSDIGTSLADSARGSYMPPIIKNNLSLKNKKIMRGY